MADLESIRPVVLQQPNGEKLQLELKITQVADDTTAIKSFEKGADISIASFDYATGIAVFLALCATVLAYWFGARSFALTKQSFDALREQIVQEKEFKNIKDLRLLCSEYITFLKQTVELFYIYYEEYQSLPFDKRFEKNSEPERAYNVLRDHIKELDIKIIQITLYFRTDEKIENDLLILDELAKLLLDRYLKDNDSGDNVELMKPNYFFNEIKDYQPNKYAKFQKVIKYSNFEAMTRTNDTLACVKNYLITEIINEFKDILNKKAA